MRRAESESEDRASRKPLDQTSPHGLQGPGSSRQRQLPPILDVSSLSRFRLFVTPWTVAYEAPPSMGFSRQEYWSGLPFPSPGDLPDPGIEHGSPELQADALPSKPSGKPAPSGNPQNSRGGERRPRLEGRPPETKTQEETAGSKSRKGCAGAGTQAEAGPGLSCPPAPSRRVGRRLVGTGGCTPCAARDAPRGRGCSCPWGPSSALPPPSPPRWRLWPNHAFPAQL